MSEFEKNINKAIKHLLEVEDIDEMNVTGNLDGGEGPVKTPAAFAASTDEKDLDDDHIEVFGYKRSNVNKTNFEGKSEYKKLMSEFHLSEASYNDYKKDDTNSNKYKVNNAIQEINRKLFEIEKLMSQNVKLKQEMGVDNNQYWKSTKHRLSKISERILQVAHKFRDLSA